MANRAELERVYGLLKEHEKNDFQAFYDLGYEAEATYGCCGQCTVIAFVRLLGIDENLFRYASGFCAGFGQMGKYPCGAFSAGALLLSYFFGREVSQMDEDPQASREIFRNTGRLLRLYEAEFSEAYGGACCADVQTKLFGRTFNLLDMEHDMPLFEAMGGHTDKCTGVVGRAARILARLICSELEQVLKNDPA